MAYPYPSHSADNVARARLVAFDGDDTLWTPLGGLFLSDRTPDDAEGFDSFVFRPLPGHPNTIERDDGPLFALNEQAHSVLTALRQAGVLTAVVSYNHVANVEAALDAFGVLRLFDYVVAEWHTGKDLMLRKLVDMARRDGYHIDYGDVLLVDDDMYGLYAGQCERIGARFACYGKDIHALSEVLGLMGLPGN